MISGGLLTMRRTYATVDAVLEAVENQTVELVGVIGNTTVELAHAVGNRSVKVVEAVGEESVKAVPVISAVLLTLLLLLLRNIIAKLWYSRKETMKRQGETPEGNVSPCISLTC